MRVLWVLATIAYIYCEAGASDETRVAKIGSDAAFLQRSLASELSTKRSLRRYNDDDEADLDSEDEERKISNQKLDDAAESLLHVKPTIQKLPKSWNIAALKKADDAATKLKSVTAMYPQGLSKSTLLQLVKVEEMRKTDIMSKTMSKKTADGMRREIKPFPGMKTAPVLTSHVGRDLQRFDEEGNRLLACVVVSRPAKRGGGDVLLISSSKPEKNDWLLPKGGWDEGEKIKTAARRELLEEGGVAGILPKKLDKLQFTNKEGKGYVYYPFKMKAKTIFDQWPESVRYRIWVSYDDAEKLLANREEMVKVVKAARTAK